MESQPLNPPPQKYTGKTKSRWTAFILTFLFGPLGFLYFGVGAFFTALVCYTGVTIFTGGFALPFLGLAVPILTALCMEPGVVSQQYKDYEKKLQDENLRIDQENRKKQEDEYYAKIGSSKLQTTLLGDPNAKKSMLQLVDNVKNGAFKEALHNLHGVIDPVSASKADEVREVEKVQHIEKVKSQSCCGTCSTQNEVGSKFCRECGETLAKAA